MDHSWTDKRYGEMNPRQKTIFVVKLLAFLLTFGFAFPTVMHSADYVKKNR